MLAEGDFYKTAVSTSKIAEVQVTATETISNKLRDQGQWRLKVKREQMILINPYLFGVCICRSSAVHDQQSEQNKLLKQFEPKWIT
jgi:hypothetical protein